EHLPDLLVLALAQRYFIPGVSAFTRSFQQLDLGRSCLDAAEFDPASQLRDLCRRRGPFDFYVIYLGNLARSSQQLGEVSVIRQYQQPLGVEIQSTDQMQARRPPRHQVDHKRSPLRV